MTDLLVCLFLWQAQGLFLGKSIFYCCKKKNTFLKNYTSCGKKVALLGFDLLTPCMSSHHLTNWAIETVDNTNYLGQYYTCDDRLIRQNYLYRFFQGSRSLKCTFMSIISNFYGISSTWKKVIRSQKSVWKKWKDFGVILKRPLQQSLSISFQFFLDWHGYWGAKSPL